MFSICCQNQPYQILYWDSLPKIYLYMVYFVFVYLTLDYIKDIICFIKDMVFKTMYKFGLEVEMNKDELKNALFDPLNESDIILV